MHRIRRMEVLRITTIKGVVHINKIKGTKVQNILLQLLFLIRKKSQK